MPRGVVGMRDLHLVGGRGLDHELRASVGADQAAVGVLGAVKRPRRPRMIHGATALGRAVLGQLLQLLSTSSFSKLEINSACAS